MFVNSDFFYILNDFNSLYKIYSDDIIINKVLYEECINYYIENSNEIVKFSKKQQNNIKIGYYDYEHDSLWPELSSGDQNGQDLVGAEDVTV